MRRALRWIGRGALAAILGAAASMLLFEAAVRFEPFTLEDLRRFPRSTRIVDAEGKLLREVVNEDGFRARWLHHELGLNVAIPVMPLHGPRTIGRRSGDGYVSGNFIDVVHAQAQAASEVRALVHWLRRRGAPAVGLYGISLGAYTAALVAALEPKLDCVIAGIPAVDFFSTLGFFFFAPAGFFRCIRPILLLK